MKLEVIQRPGYISPSSFSMYRNCSFAYFLIKLSGKFVQQQSQNLPSATGWAFDILICNAIAKHFGLQDDPTYDIQSNLEKQIPDSQLRVQAHILAQDYFTWYVKLGCLDRLLKEGIARIHGEDTRVFPEFTLHGRPDLGFSAGVPVEVKVSGAGSKTGQSPSPGYIRAVYTNGQVKGPHERCNDYFETINSDWATQLTIYHWNNCGIHPIKEIPANIEQVAVRGGTIAFASIRSTISAEFQVGLYTELKKMWEAIQTGEFEQPTPHPQKCIRFNQLCPAAEHCEYYQRTQSEDPTLRALKGF